MNLSYLEEYPQFKSLNVLATLCHDLSAQAGWWPENPDHETHATKIALIHSEVSEMLEGMRKGLADDHLPARSMEEVEAADILIRLFDYAGARNLDLAGAMVEKLIYNAERADHKPEARSAAGGKRI